MSLEKVQRALMSAISQHLDGIPTAYENNKFVTPNGSKWAAVYFMPNQPSVETLGDNGLDFVDGIVQVDLNYAPGNGSAEAREDFEMMRYGFRAGNRLSYDGQAAIIVNCGRSQGRIVDGWYRVSITIGWYALIPR